MPDREPGRWVAEEDGSGELSRWCLEGPGGEYLGEMDLDGEVWPANDGGFKFQEIAEAVDLYRAWRGQNGRWRALGATGGGKEWALRAKCNEEVDGTVEYGEAILRWWAGDSRFGPSWTIEDVYGIEWTADDLEAAARIVRENA